MEQIKLQGQPGDRSQAPDFDLLEFTTHGIRVELMAADHFLIRSDATGKLLGDVWPCTNTHYGDWAYVFEPTPEHTADKSRHQAVHSAFKILTRILHGAV